MNKPTIGRIVIFKDGAGQEWPAIITRVWDETCININYFSDAGAVVYTSCRQGEENYTWNWPKCEE